MRNNSLILSLFLVLSLFSSCKDEDVDRLKIGMFVVGDGYNDAGYKQNCREGLLMALQESSFDTLFVSSLSHTQDELDYFPQQNCDALFLVGSLAAEELLVTAAENPQKQFIIIDYNYEGTLQNVQTISYNINEAAFPLGFLAAYWASSKDMTNPVVGIIGGINIEAIQRYMKAYSLGIAYYNNKYNLDVKVVESFLNSFDDTDYGYKVADSLINNAGADVILPVAGAAGNGSVYAAKANNKWAIGTDDDQYYSLPDLSDIFLSSCMKQLDTTIYSVATTFINNPVISNSAYVGTLKNQGVSLAPFHDYDTQIPDSIKNTLATIKEGIISGTINTGF